MNILDIIDWTQKHNQELEDLIKQYENHRDKDILLERINFYEWLQDLYNTGHANGSMFEDMIIEKLEELKKNVS